MCGIAGIVGVSANCHAVQRAMDAMRHRGPDQAGCFIGNQVVFGHRRLSVIDLSELGRQPMASQNDQAIITFNGEIYNFQDLRHQLQPRCSFRSQSDTEVLLQGYCQWGIDRLLREINGMFAFAIWDGKQQVLHLVKDRCGKKPLYYRIENNQIFFASTISGILALLGKSPEVSISAIGKYLNYLSVPSPDSIFEGIQKLPAGYRLEFRLGGPLVLKRYWRLNFGEREQATIEEWIERIDCELRRAVAQRMIADVPLTCFLSGGVDSSTVAAIMADLSGKRISTVSIGFSHETHNELEYSRQVAQRWNTDHHEYLVTPASISDLPKIIHHFGEPFADHSALPSYTLAKFARQHGTVVLTGDGGDESFAGYESVKMFAWHRLLHPISGIPMAALTRMLRKRATSSNTIWRKLQWVAETYSRRTGNYVFDAIGSRNFRFLRNTVFSLKLANSISQQEIDQLYTDLWNDNIDLNWIDRSLVLDFEKKLANTFLPKVDVTTMAHSLEARSPFLDYRLVELAAKIPASMKINRGQAKWMLKKLAERYLPYQVIYRRKMGFSVPLDDWFRGDLNEVARRLLCSTQAISRDLFRSDGVERLLDEHRSGKWHHGQRIWSMVVLEVWFLLFVDKILKPQDNLVEFSCSLT